MRKEFCHAIFLFLSQLFLITALSLFLAEGPFRGYMRACYHTMCDDVKRVSQDNIKFLKLTTEVIAATVIDLAMGSCPGKNYNAPELNLHLPEKMIICTKSMFSRSFQCTTQSTQIVKAQKTIKLLFPGHAALIATMRNLASVPVKYTIFFLFSLAILYNYL